MWNLYDTYILLPDQQIITLNKYNMKVKNYLLSALMLLLASSLMAQSNFGEIKGKVVEKIGKVFLPVQYAEVWVELGASRLPTETDSLGKYTLKPLNPGEYTVFATSFGYDTIQLTNVIVEPDKITFADRIRIDGQIQIVQAVKLIDPEETSVIGITAAEIETNASMRNLAGLVGTMSSDIKVDEDGEIYFRGSRSGSSIYYIDGVKLTGDLANLPGISYQSVRAYTGGVPAKYGDTTGGVIVIETKSYFDLWRAHKIAMGH